MGRRYANEKGGENMDESTTYTDCELEYMGEGYDSSQAAEICANEEVRPSDEETEESGRDMGGEYWFG
jgi:hypothetical protein